MSISRGGAVCLSIEMTGRIKCYPEERIGNGHNQSLYDREK